MNPTEQMQDKLRNRFLALIRESPDPKVEMSELGRLVADSFQITPDQDSPELFVDDLMSDGPGRRLAEVAVQKGKDLDGVENPQELLLSLLPSAHHLE
jgi:hypothetical protein